MSEITETPKFVREGGGMLRRIVHTLEQFRVKHGCWPTELVMHSGDLAALIEHNLTPLGFYLLQQKVHVVCRAHDDRPLWAADETGRACDYMEHGIEVPEDGLRATEWLGFGEESA